MTPPPPCSVAAPPPRVAFFDYDDTLIKGDSLPLFLGALIGWPRLLITLLAALLRPDKTQPDRKGAIKAAWLSLALNGVALSRAQQVAKTLRPVWKEDIRQRLLALHQEGVTIVVATGAMDIYIHTLLRELPIDEIIATRMEVKDDGSLTGRMEGGNCVRTEKARRVAQWLQNHGPFVRTYGFGNAPSDLPMLALLDEKTIV